MYPGQQGEQGGSHDTFRQISEEVIFFRRTQITKYTHAYSITMQIECPQVIGEVINREPVLQIMEDADFHITHMTGSVTDIVTATGTRPPNITGTDYGLMFPLATTINKGDRGIWFKFEDPKVNRPLQLGIPNDGAVIKALQYLSPYDNTMMDFGSVFSPGYGYSWGKPIRFDYTLMKNTRLKVLLQNRQRTNGGGAHYSRVSMAFIGHRYEN